MQVHVAELIDQHRRADELDDVSFGRVIQLFYEAQIACTGERYQEALATYSAIPIGRLIRAPRSTAVMRYVEAYDPNPLSGA